MHGFVVDYKADRSTNALFHRGFFLYGIPRWNLRCRLLGHRPVVDGTGRGAELRQSRWVTCGRCGQRPEPQGSLNPNVWDIGEHYIGPFAPATYTIEQAKALAERKALRPGPWGKPTPGAVGAEVVIWPKNHFGWGFSVKVGKTWSEHTLAASIHFGRFLSIHPHTEKFGLWLCRLLNPRDEVSKEIEFQVGGSDDFGPRLSWKVWTPRDECRHPNSWRAGWLNLSLADALFGPARYSYQTVKSGVAATVRLPDGTDHQVTLKLQRQLHGRNRGLRKQVSWVVDWACSPGIPTKPGDAGCISGSAVKVPHSAVQDGTWPAEAAAEIALWICRLRTRSGYGMSRELAVR